MIIQSFVCGVYISQNLFPYIKRFLLRECRRNSQLRQLCGLQSNYIPRDDSNPYLRLVPSSAAMEWF